MSRVGDGHVWNAGLALADMTRFPKPRTLPILIFGIIVGERGSIKGIVNTNIQVVLARELVLITCDVGNPNVFQPSDVEWTQDGCVVTMVRLVAPSCTIDELVVVGGDCFGFDDGLSARCIGNLVGTLFFVAFVGDPTSIDGMGYLMNEGVSGDFCAHHNQFANGKGLSMLLSTGNLSAFSS